jgi:hypothetical protein
MSTRMKEEKEPALLHSFPCVFWLAESGAPAVGSAVFGRLNDKEAAHVDSEPSDSASPQSKDISF